MHNEILEKIAIERMNILFGLALKRTLEDNESSSMLARRYIKLAKEISTHYKIKMPREIKRRICNKCNRVLVPGLTCKVRLSSSDSFIVYKCICGNELRIHY